MDVIADVTAASGHADDIQDAVDQVEALGGGRCLIPAGTFNFYNVGETWSAVVIPPKVSIFGAPTVKTSGQSVPERGMNPNGQVVAWNTVLQMPFDVDDAGHTNMPWFFALDGEDDPTLFRFSDIKLVGYRSIVGGAWHHQTWHGGLGMQNVPNFRVDHCSFENCTYSAVAAPRSSGVIDHSRLFNTHGAVAWDYILCDMDYGLMIQGDNVWETHIDDVLGQHTDQTIFIEDCYLSRWRHVYSAWYSLHVVFRYNTVVYDSVVGSLDGHGYRFYAAPVFSVRAMEIYNNVIVDPILNWQPNYDSMTPANGTQGYGVFYRGGGGVAFDNLFRNYYVGIQMSLEGADAPDYQRCHDLWYWDNEFVNIGYANITSIAADCVQNTDYWIISPPESFPATLPGPTYTGKPSISYSPYTYPHPFTIETTDAAYTSYVSPESIWMVVM